MNVKRGKLFAKVLIDLIVNSESECGLEHRARCTQRCTEDCIERRIGRYTEGGGEVSSQARVEIDGKRN